MIPQRAPGGCGATERELQTRQGTGRIIKINDVIHLVAKEKFNIHINWLGKPWRGV